VWPITEQFVAEIGDIDLAQPMTATRGRVTVSVQLDTSAATAPVEQFTVTGDRPRHDGPRDRADSVPRAQELRTAQEESP
jgi:hypothetical protein